MDFYPIDKLGRLTSPFGNFFQTSQRLPGLITVAMDNRATTMTEKEEVAKDRVVSA